MPEPARGLRNARATDNALVCPKCERPIAPDATVVFLEDYALHLRCADKAEDAKAL
jgi:hypothetical protein